jgi:AraC family transcriptional regulator
VKQHDSRSEYARRFHRVIEHIDRNIAEPLDLDALARVANFSPFHFHRLFAAWMGETAADYVRRRRVELGALRLATQPDSSVLQVALAVGFSSGESFARAFRTRFGASPTEWREQDRKNRQTNRKNGQDAIQQPSQLPVSPLRETRMKVTIENLKPTHVAYMRHVGAYGEPVSRFWREVVAPWMMTNHLMNCVRYGVSHDDPSITDADQCRYDACVVVPEGFKGTGNYHETTLAGGRCAVTRFKGTVEEITGVWAELLREWLPSSGMQLDARPFLEYYDQGMSFDPQTGVFECDLCIPVHSL